MSTNDTHPEQIKALLRIEGTSLAELARKHGCPIQSLSAAIRLGTMPRWEQVIATALKTEPKALWPVRYAERERKAAERAALSAEIEAYRDRPRPRRRGRPPIRTTPDAVAARAGSPR